MHFLNFYFKVNNNTLKVYDYYVDKVDFKWKEWKLKLNEDNSIPSNPNFNEILVDTIETLTIKQILYYAVKYEY
jgi:hypothetical protein